MRGLDYLQVLLEPFMCATLYVYVYAMHRQNQLYEWK